MLQKLTYTGRPNELGALYEASRFSTVEEIRDYLKPYYDDLVNLYENELVLLIEDYRSGRDSYGYENIDVIKHTLMYISDRWRVTFRVRWLIDLINPDYQLWDGQLKNTDKQLKPVDKIKQLEKEKKKLAEAIAEFLQAVGWVEHKACHSIKLFETADSRPIECGTMNFAVLEKSLEKIFPDWQNWIK